MSPIEIVGAMIYLLEKEEGIFTEEYVQKLLFLALYKKGTRNHKGKEYAILDMEGINLIPDYMLTLNGVFSPTVSRAIAKLYIDEILEKDDEYTFLVRNHEPLRKMYENLDDNMRERLEDVVKKYAKLKVKDIQRLINDLFALNSLIYGMSLGMRFIDIVNAFARITSKGKS